MTNKKQFGAIAKIVILLLALSIASVAATQVLAWRWQYHQALGKPLQGHWYWPWDWLKWSMRFYDTHSQIVMTGIAVFLMTLTMMLLVFYMRIMLIKRDTSAMDDLHGSAHWASKQEIQETGLLDCKGVYVGAWTDKNGKTWYLRHDGPEHIIAFAPTRSGKGVGLVLPTLLSWPESALVYDIKGENWALTAGWRQQYAGNAVLKFDPGNFIEGDPEAESCCFNPLAEVRLDDERAVGDVQNLAAIIVDPQGKGMESHWDKTAFALLTGAILHTLYKIRKEEQRTANLTDVATLLSNPDMPVTDVLQEMLEYEHTDSGAHPVVAAEARAMLNKAEEELSSVVSTAIANLSLYRDPIVARHIARSDFRIDDLMDHEQPVTLYVVDRPSDADRMRPLIRLIMTQIVRRRTEKMEFRDGRSVRHYKHRLLLLSDEFPALKKLNAIEDGLAFMAGYGIKAYIICQDIQQLNAIYSREEKIIANCHIRIGYAPTKVETAEVFSKMSGTATVIKEEVSVSGSRFGGAAKSYNRSYREHQRPLITTDEVMRLKKPKKEGHGENERIVEAGELLVFVAGSAPIRGTQILYFNDQTFRERAAVPPPEKSDVLTPKTRDFAL